MTSINRRADGNVAKGLCTWACLFLLMVLPARVRADDPFKALALTRPKQPLTAHDFTVPGLTAASIRLSDFRGKVVLLNFWATWCSPCRVEMPAMERLYQRHKTEGFAVLGISVDRQGAAVVTPFAKSFKLTFPGTALPLTPWSRPCSGSDKWHSTPGLAHDRRFRHGRLPAGAPEEE